MAVFVDYRCGSCGATQELLVTSPPPGSAACGACDGAARRVWSPVGLVGRAGQAADPGLAETGSLGGDTGGLCRTNRDIPGLCTFSPTAARSLVARVRGDNRALEAEIAYQERMQKESPGTLTVGGHASAGGEHSHAPSVPAAAAPGAGSPNPVNRPAPRRSP